MRSNPPARCACTLLHAITGAVLLSLASPGALADQPIGTAFTYQGELAVGGSPASGVYDLRFHLFDDGSAGTELGTAQCFDNVTVTNGRFTLTLDFGAQFAGSKRWLVIEVRADTGLDCTNLAGFTTLTPRQELTPAPHAVFAGSAGSAGTAATAGNAAQLNGQGAAFYQDATNLALGTIADARLSSNIPLLMSASPQTFTGKLILSDPTNMISGAFTGDGSALTSLDASQISIGVLNPARLPTTWPAGGALSGFYPNPTVALGAISRSKLDAELNSVLGTIGTAWVASGSAATSPMGYFVTTSGSYAYVVTLSNTLQAFDISNPTSPTPLGTPVATGPGATSVAVSGSRAYVTNTSASTLQMFDISNPASIPPAIASAATGAGPYVVTVSGSYAYVVNSTGNTLQVFDISNPAVLPPAIGSVGTDVQPSFVTVSGSYAYVVHGHGTQTLKVFDVSNPASIPPALGSAATGLDATSIAISGSHAFVVCFGDSVLQTFDVSNPAALTQVSSIPTAPSPASVALAGPYLYVVCSGSNRFQAFSISDPASPTQATSGTGIEVLGAPIRVAASGSNACIVTYSGNLRMVTPVPATEYSVASSIFSGSVAASSFTGSGAALTDLSASSITTGTLAASTLSGVDGSGLTNVHAATAATATNALALNGQPDSFYLDAGNMNAGTLDNARTTGTASSTPNTLVLRDGSGDFSTGTINAATLNVGGASNDGTGARRFIVKRNALQGIYMSFQDEDSGTNEWEWHGDNSNASLGLDAGFSRRVTFLQDGNIGMGTSNPLAEIGYPLSFYGGLHVKDPRDGVNAGAVALVDGDLLARLHLQARGNSSGARNFVLQNKTDQVQFQWQGDTLGPRVSIMVMDYDGNVGIGTTPSEKLTVNGNILATGTITPSCARLKENVVPMGDALERLSNLNAVRFDWKPDEARTRGFTHDLGFIAEDVAKAFPEVVFHDATGKIMGLDYSRMSAVAVGAIKELKAENDKVKADNADLKARLEKIEALLAAQATAATKNAAK